MFSIAENLQFGFAFGDSKIVESAVKKYFEEEFGSYCDKVSIHISRFKPASQVAKGTVVAGDLIARWSLTPPGRVGYVCMAGA